MLGCGAGEDVGRGPVRLVGRQAKGARFVGNVRGMVARVGKVSGGQASSQSDLQEGEGTLSGRDDCSGRSGVEDGQTSGGMELFAQGHRRQNREVREAQEGAPDRARNH